MPVDVSLRHEIAHLLRQQVPEPGGNFVYGTELVPFLRLTLDPEPAAGTVRLIFAGSVIGFAGLYGYLLQPVAELRPSGCHLQKTIRPLPGNDRPKYRGLGTVVECPVRGQFFLVQLTEIRIFDQIRGRDEPERQCIRLFPRSRQHKRRCQQNSNPFSTHKDLLGVLVCDVFE